MGNAHLSHWSDANAELDNIEIIDARLSADTHLVAALFAVVAIAAVISYAMPKIRYQDRNTPKAWWMFASIFLVAAVADLATTVWFFHVRGIDHELHPGIRLFGYAYGRTIGPIAGKAVQAVGVLGISLLFVRGSRILLSLVAILYSLATEYDLVQM